MLRVSAPDHYCRVVMNECLRAIVSKLPAHTFDVAEISGRAWCDYGFRSHESFQFPMHDICAGIDAGPFDLVIAEQVWEHLRQPYRAAQNVYRMLRPGGYFLISVPFLIKKHPAPIDCMRWSKEGLKCFLAEVGFPEDGIAAFEWGNRQCVLENLDDWVSYDPARHTLENDEEFPLVSWALAKRIS